MATTLVLGSGNLMKYAKGAFGLRLPELTTHVVVGRDGVPNGYVTIQYGGYVSWFSLPRHVLLFHGTMGSLTALLDARRRPMDG